MAGKQLTPEQREKNRQRCLEYYYANLEVNRAKGRDRARANSVKLREYSRQWRLDHPREKKPRRRTTPEEKKARDRAYHLAHREEHNAKMRLWAEKNIEKKRAADRQYRSEHIEKVRAKDREYTRTHRSENVIRSREWRANNPEAANAISRAWAARNPERKAVVGRNNKAKRKAVSGKHTLADIARLFELQNGLCVGCNAVLIPKGKGKYHVDHIHPISKGGSNGPENLQLLCPPCNFSKNAGMPARSRPSRIFTAGSMPRSIRGSTRCELAGRGAGADFPRGRDRRVQAFEGLGMVPGSECSLYFKELPDGRLVTVIPLTFGRARITIGRGYKYLDVW